MGQISVEPPVNRPWRVPAVCGSLTALAATALLGGILAGPGLAAPAVGSQDVTVQRVIDGDTIEVHDQDGEVNLVRYLGIDAPELRRRSPDGRWRYDPKPYAEAALALNRRLVEGKRIHLEYDKERRDRYGRLLAYVYVDGHLVNAELVEHGLARARLHAPNTRFAGLFLRLQREARAHRRGIWANVRMMAADRP